MIDYLTEPYTVPYWILLLGGFLFGWFIQDVFTMIQRIRKP